ncbi:23S rRNA (guanosine(2251)-2'-O)-methyltransferase RlmB [Prochlorococcus marinus]|uniref:23S rRNA (guanosine(2251)-2'-O)-methyltransferase RlmB n=1 Tax=Prochlorococcus marinus TaxID=1219 RepID=UPI0022B54B19|nr:23S rRNA (guanosine(2251)-2'-O)-methyltransferase RlmB [Prochlorococcus marinus]
MSFKDRRGRKTSRSSSIEGRKYRGNPSSMSWQETNKDQSQGKTYRKASRAFSENFVDNENQKRDLRNKKNKSTSNQSFSSPTREWGRVQSKRNTDRFSNNSEEVKYFDRRRKPIFQKHQKEGFINKNQNHEREEEKTVFHNESNDIFWGRHVIQSILESGRPIHRIWCTGEIRSSPRFFQLLKDAKSLGVLVEEVSWARLAHLTSGGVHQGIALQTAASETFDLKALIEGCSSLDEPPVLIALDGLTDPHNLGAIVRSSEALGAHGIILPQRRSAGLTGSVAKVAAGALEHLPVARVVNLNRAIEELKRIGYTAIGLAGDGDKTVNEISFDGPLVLVIGSEDKGLSLLTRKYCDELVRIPLRGVTSSLNASVATSVFMYEIARQGWMKDLSGQAPSPKLLRAKLTTKPLKDY